MPLADALRLRDSRDSRWFIGRRVRLADELPRGDYELSFDVPGAPLETSRFRWKVKPPKRGGRLRGALDADEPEIIDGPQPAIGGPGTRISMTVFHAFDATDPKGVPSLLLGNDELSDVQSEPGDEDGSTVLSGTVPADITAGGHDVVVRTNRGQVAVAADAFTVPPAHAVMGITPDLGSPVGGYPITIAGSGFRPGGVEILVDGSAEPVTFLLQTGGTLRFVAPPHAAGAVTFAVRDVDTGRTAALSSGSFTYEDGPVIATVAPGLTPILGGDTIGLSGFQFAETDRVFLESSTPGEFEEITATQSTYRDDTSHEFVAPVRPAGRYEVYIQAESGERSVRSNFLDYFQLSDFTDRLGLEASAPDNLHDGWTTDLADFDGDGDQDLFLARRGSGPRQETSQLALFENDGSGSLTDVTALRIQAPSAGDDWRADRIRVVDVTRDGRPDIVLTTSDLDVPGPTLSHTRILANEQRSEAAGPDDRVFRDRTLDLFARLTLGDDPFDGHALAIGDPDGDGAPEYVMTRAVPTGTGTQTRAIATDR